MKPENGIRYDSATVELEGLIEDEAVLRCSLVCSCRCIPYTHSDGRIVREAKLPEELFSPETLASIPGRPITKNILLFQTTRADQRYELFVICERPLLVICRGEGRRNLGQ
ncbi:DUF2213 domain-containing protein [Leptospira noguchii]|nr:DUF2213 domain-containing protein [Leptospira noguchii]